MEMQIEKVLRWICFESLSQCHSLIMLTYLILRHEN